VYGQRPCPRSAYPVYPHFSVVAEEWRTPGLLSSSAGPMTSAEVLPVFITKYRDCTPSEFSLTAIDAVGSSICCTLFPSLCELSAIYAHTPGALGLFSGAYSLAATGQGAARYRFSPVVQSGYHARVPQPWGRPCHYKPRLATLAGPSGAPVRCCIPELATRVPPWPGWAAYGPALPVHAQAKHDNIGLIFFRFS